MVQANGSDGPTPISWQPSEGWDGDDGDWSTFFLRVGTPEQTVRVLPSTAGQASWVVTEGGCQPSSQFCSNARGDLVNINASSTWKDFGPFDLGLERNFGRNESGDFGLDSVALGLSNATEGPTLDNQIVVGIETNLYRVGMFGLNQQPTNLSNFTNTYPSFLTSLKTQNLIPSLSWAYTAGARYKSKGVIGALTLGGYDQSRFTPNNISFNLAEDVERDLVVGLQSITAKYENGSSQALLSASILTFIDSTIPYIYLPVAVCQNFEKEFGLSWNETNNIYFVDETLHQTLSDANPSFTFTIGNDKESQPTVDIVLPYASFDLAFKPPFPTSGPYFPIRRATNDSQYTLGRTFLQEAYLITNYEHNNFTIAQSRFDARAKAEIMALPSGDVTPTPGRHSTNRKIVIGAAVGSSTFAVCLFLILFFIIRKRLGSWRAKPRKSSSLSESFHRWLPNDAKLVNEIGFNSLYNPRAELYDTGKVEIQGSVMPPGTSDTARESSSFLSRTVRSKRTSKDLLKVPELRVNTVPITGARKIKARNRHGGHQSSQEVYTKRRRHSSIHDAKPLPLVPFPRQETLKSVLPSSGKARQQLAPYNRHAKSTVEQDSTAHRSAHDSQTLSFEKSTQLQMPPDLDSCLTVSRAPSASSTYANIIDYDYYRHGTPAQEIEEKPA